jgi:Ca-activated chloride channel family protein
MHPSGPVDIFAGEDLVILARYDGSGAATLRFEGETANGPVSWATNVRFPERSRENPYVARLWATQRVGYLSAEKRQHGGSQEIDTEIRELGERYGIPTEFSSYLVLEPGMNLQARRIGSQPVQLNSVVTTGVPTEADLSGRAAGVSAAAPSARAFEAAKTAAAQRSATNMAVADSLSAFKDEATVRRLGNLTFVLRDSVWTDVRYRRGLPMLRVKAFSEAYFALIERMPELRQAFSVSERLRIAGRAMTIELTPDGKEQLTDRDLVLLREHW